MLNKKLSLAPTLGVIKFIIVKNDFWVLLKLDPDVDQTHLCGLNYIEKIMTVNDTSSVVISDAPSCGVIYNHHSD